jgi:hypothetical protein
MVTYVVDVTATVEAGGVADPVSHPARTVNSPVSRVKQAVRRSIGPGTAPL